MKNKLGILSASIFLSALIFAVFLFPHCPGEVYAAPEEPPLSELHRWYASEDGTIILEYRLINKHAIQLWRFKHALKAAAEKAPSCNEVVVNGDEIRLLTQESKPSLYLIKKESDGSAPEFSLDFTYDLW